MKRILNLIFKPGSLVRKIAAKMLMPIYRCKNSLFDLNNQEYWDRAWKKELEMSSRLKLYKLYDKVFSLVPEGCKLVDVGCGIGVFLERIKREKKCQVFGVDISKKAIETIKAKGIDGAVQKIPPLQLPTESFDVVVAIQLLEHLRKPLPAIKELLRVVKAGGWCLISVPDDCLYPRHIREHLCSFTKNEINKLIKKTKYKTELSFFPVTENDTPDIKRLLVACKKII
ncbi:class I SAM-dependent methyltransferase [Candidatus Omnitrophota bacterium]